MTSIFREQTPFSGRDIHYGGELFTHNSLAIRTITFVSIKDYVLRVEFD
jgi:hypothetical protein